MCRRNVGAAVVLDPEAPGPGVITERDILRGGRLRARTRTRSCVADHLTADLTFASPDWSLEHAAAAMVRGGFRHLVVVDGGELAGILSMRDIVRCWTRTARPARCRHRPDVAARAAVGCTVASAAPAGARRRRLVVLFGQLRHVAAACRRPTGSR